MAYETGTATDAADLLSKLRTFATANGWTEDNYGARTSGPGNALQIHKGSHYLTFKTDTSAGSAVDPGPYFGVYGHDTYNGANGTESQAGASAITWANGMVGPFLAYHFISNAELGANYLYCIVEVTSGIFKHFGTGTLVKIGAITNGQFVHAQRWYYLAGLIDTPASSFHAVPFDVTEINGQRNGAGTNVRVDADGITPRWMDGSQSPSTAGRSMRGGPRTDSLGLAVMMNNAASALTGRNMLCPCFLYAERSGGLYNPLGYPPGVRWVRLTYLEPNAVVTIGSDNWKVFPVIRKNGTTGQVNSGVFGYAYKVN